MPARPTKKFDAQIATPVPMEVWMQLEALGKVTYTNKSFYVRKALFDSLNRYVEQLSHTEKTAYERVLENLRTAGQLKAVISEEENAQPRTEPTN